MSVVQNKIIIIVCVCVVVGFSVSMKMKRAVVALCSKSAETRRRRRSFHKKHQGWLVGWLSRGEGGDVLSLVRNRQWPLLSLSL